MARLPDQIGKYEVVDRIGKGGMGMVYKARHPSLDRFVILKKLAVSGNAAMRERFRREAEIMIDFRTDFVVDVYDHFRHGTSDYIAMEFVDGGSLDAILERERYLPGDVALLIVADCCRGLDYVHSKGVIHRDVKPGNVILGRDGSVKLLDFGIASREESFDQDLTSEGMTLGTVAYIAPEQIEQSRGADVRADVYSTGAMLYEMVTGRKAFPGGFTPENVNRIQKGRYRRPRRVNPQVSRFASRLIRRCMKRNPARRYQSAAEITASIERSLRRRKGSQIREWIGQYAGGETPTRDTASRRRWPRLLVAAAILIIAAGAAAFGTGYLQRFFMGETHGLAHYQIRLRKGDRAYGEHLVRLELQRMENGEFIDLTPVLPLLHPVASLETPDYLTARSRLLTLPAGRYRSTIQVGEVYFQEELTIRPVVTDTDIQLLAIQYDPEHPSAIPFTVFAYDGATGAEVADAIVEAEIDGTWVVVSGVPDEELPDDELPGELQLVSLESFLSGDFERDDASGDDPLAGESPGDDLVSDDLVMTGQRAGDSSVADPLSGGISPGQATRVRATHPEYHSVTTEVTPGEFARATLVRLEMISIKSPLEEN